MDTRVFDNVTEIIRDDVATTITKGSDITAYKDELPPRILVQVKSQNRDYGLFVTLSNYTKNAQKYLNSTPIIRGINGTELVELILKYYDNLSEKYKKMIPLKQVYILVPKE